MTGAELSLSQPLGAAAIAMPQAEIVEDFGGRSRCRSLQRVAVLQASWITHNQKVATSRKMSQHVVRDLDLH